MKLIEGRNKDFSKNLNFGVDRISILWSESGPRTMIAEVGRWTKDVGESERRVGDDKTL